MLVSNGEVYINVFVIEECIDLRMIHIITELTTFYGFRWQSQAMTDNSSVIYNDNHSVRFKLICLMELFWRLYCGVYNFEMNWKM